MFLLQTILKNRIKLRMILNKLTLLIVFLLLLISCDMSFRNESAIKDAIVEKANVKPKLTKKDIIIEKEFPIENKKYYIVSLEDSTIFEKPFVYSNGIGILKKETIAESLKNKNFHIEYKEKEKDQLGNHNWYYIKAAGIEGWVLEDHDLVAKHSKKETIDHFLDKKKVREFFLEFGNSYCNDSIDIELLGDVGCIAITFRDKIGNSSIENSDHFCKIEKIKNFQWNLMSEKQNSITLKKLKPGTIEIKILQNKDPEFTKYNNLVVENKTACSNKL